MLPEASGKKQVAYIFIKPTLCACPKDPGLISFRRSGNTDQFWTCKRLRETMQTLRGPNRWKWERHPGGYMVMFIVNWAVYRVFAYLHL